MDLDIEDYYSRPRRRYFKWRANAKAGRMHDGSAGGFNGVCSVWEGDEFFMELSPISVEYQDGGKRAKGGGQMPKLPTWADPIEEYEPPSLAALKPLAQPKKPEPVPLSGRRTAAASAE